MPNFYVKAAEVLDKVESKKASLNSAIYSDSTVTNKKRTLRLLCEYLKCNIHHILNKDRDTIYTVLKNAEFFKIERKLDKSLAGLLCYEVIFGNGISGDGKYKSIMAKHKARINAELVKFKIKNKIKSNDELIPLALRNNGLISFI
jgi:putative methyltransferase